MSSRNEPNRKAGLANLRDRLQEIMCVLKVFLMCMTCPLKFLSSLPDANFLFLFVMYVPRVVHDHVSIIKYDRKCIVLLRSKNCFARVPRFTM